MTDRSRVRPRRLILWLAVLVLWGLDTHGNWAGTGDEPHYAMMAHSLVFDRDLDLANDYASPANLVNRGGLESGPHVRPGKDGVIRPVHDVGLPIVAAPYFAVAYGATEAVVRVVPQSVLARGRLDPPLLFRHLLSLGVILLSAFTARRLFAILAEISGENRRAFVWTCLFALSPPLLAYGFLFFTEMPAAAIVTWLCGVLLVAPVDERTAPRFRPLLLGIAVGFLPLLHVRLAGLALGFVLLYVWQRGVRPLRATAEFFLPIAAIAGFRIWLSERFWGTVIVTPHVRVGETADVASNLVVGAQRLLALCFDQAHGLLTYAPIYLLVLPGAIVLWRTEKRRCEQILLLLACYLVPVALPALNAHGWDGGWSPAGRFLVPILPLLVIAGFSYLARLERWPPGVKVLAGVQIALDVVCWSRPKIMWNETGPSALLKMLSPPSFDVSRWFPSWNEPSRYTVLVSICALMAWIAVSILAVGRTTARSSDQRRGEAMPAGE